jgi:hypothetical protein
MRIFQSKWFVRFVRKEGISENALYEAVKQIEAGNYDADLGSGVFKQRVARAGGGQSGGYRTILCVQSGQRAFYVYGFAKSSRGNISKGEVGGFRKLARILFAMTEEQLEAMLKNGSFHELPRAGGYDHDQGV